MPFLGYKKWYCAIQHILHLSISQWKDLRLYASSTLPLSSLPPHFLSNFIFVTQTFLFAVCFSVPFTLLVKPPLLVHYYMKSHPYLFWMSASLVLIFVACAGLLNFPHFGVCHPFTFLSRSLFRHPSNTLLHSASLIFPKLDFCFFFFRIIFH